MKKLIQQITDLLSVVPRLLPLLAFINKDIETIVEGRRYEAVLSGIETIRKGLITLEDNTVTPEELKAVLMEASEIRAVRRALRKIETDEVTAYLFAVVQVLDEIKAGNKESEEVVEEQA